MVAIKNVNLTIIIFHFVISGPPSEPAGVYVDGTTLTSVSVVIQWIRPADNGASISSYVLETYNHWEKFWRIHETS